VFWIGAVGVGFLIPLVLNALGSRVRESAGTFYLSAICSVCGMMSLRLFVLYAGQLNAA
jgi:protein NrfD